VPRSQAGPADGALITAQRIGTAIGTALIGTVLFGSESGQNGNARLTPSLTHTAQSATVPDLALLRWT
jgi:hypothetical protein